MTNQNENLSRRNFLKLSGGLGAGAVAATKDSLFPSLATQENQPVYLSPEEQVISRILSGPRGMSLDSNTKAEQLLSLVKSIDGNPSIRLLPNIQSGPSLNFIEGTPTMTGVGTSTTLNIQLTEHILAIDLKQAQAKDRVTSSLLYNAEITQDLRFTLDPENIRTELFPLIEAIISTHGSERYELGISYASISQIEQLGSGSFSGASFIEKLKTENLVSDDIGEDVLLPFIYLLEMSENQDQHKEIMIVPFTPESGASYIRE